MSDRALCLEKEEGRHQRKKCLFVCFQEILLKFRKQNLFYFHRDPVSSPLLPQLGEVETLLQAGGVRNTEFSLSPAPRCGQSFWEVQVIRISHPPPRTCCGGEALGKSTRHAGLPYPCSVPLMRWRGFPGHGTAENTCLARGLGLGLLWWDRQAVKIWGCCPPFQSTQLLKWGYPLKRNMPFIFYGCRQLWSRVLTRGRVSHRPGDPQSLPKEPTLLAAKGGEGQGAGGGEGPPGETGRCMADVSRAVGQLVCQRAEEDNWKNCVTTNHNLRQVCLQKGPDWIESIWGAILTPGHC